MIKLREISKTIKSKGRYWIAFTGDSITSCEWVHPNWREIVEYVLKEESVEIFDGDWKTPSWAIRTFNFGFDGATTKDILDKVEDINLIKPDLVVGLMGGNDPTFNISVEAHVENIKEIIKKLHTKTVWCTSTSAREPSKKNLEYEPYATAFMKILDNENLQKVDMFSIYRNFPTEKFFTFISEENPVEKIKAGELDLQHPNQLGNAYIAKVILKDVFGIDFNPEKYWKDVLALEKFPGY